MLSHSLFARARRAIVAALLAAIAPALLIASPVAAANNIVISALYGDCGFFGSNAGAGKTIKIEWRDAEGELKSKHKVTSDLAGDFFTRCDLGEIVETGDVLRTQIGTNLANVRLFTVPKLTVSVSRDSDTVSGRVETSGLDTLLVLVDTYDGGFGVPSGHQTTPTVGANPGVQNYSTFQTWVPPDIKGWDDVTVVWTNTRGDTFVRFATAPAMRFWVRQPFIEIVGSPGGGQITAELKTPSAVTLATASAGNTIFGSPVSATWSDFDGDSVRARPGQHVSASALGSDAADVVIPSISATINKATDRVTVDCNITESGQTGVLVAARKLNLSDFGERLGFQNNASGGTFLANFASGGAVNIASGDKVDVYCKYASGDVVAQTFTVP